MIPQKLQKEEYRFILVKKNDKIPIEKEWQKTNNYTFDNQKLIDHINNGGNYGVATGYGNLIVIDFDNEELQNKFYPLLPTTFTVMSGSGLLHLYYLVDVPETIKLLDINNNTLADIQGKGKQIIGAGSVHPNGNSYCIVKDEEIATIGIGEIKALFNEYIQNGQQKDIGKVNEHQDTTCGEIKQKLSVPQLLNEYGITTNKNPTECPLHNSRGGKCLSFKEEVWHCFNCENGGDVFNLYMLYNKCDFKTAKKELAKKLGIEIKSPINMAGLKVDGYLDNVNNFYETQPFFYDKAGIFWFWNGEEYKWEVVDEIDLMNALDKRLSFAGLTISSTIRNNYIETFKRVGRERSPKEPKKSWVQFKNKIFDYETKTIVDATPEYFICNPIPWVIGTATDTPIIDKLFEEWVGIENVQTLYEIIAYCCIIDYPIHLCFCLIGSGRNGKTQFQKLLTKFVGKDNVCSTELDTLLDSRFESVKLYKKLVCSLGETNFGVLNKTSLLKKLTGQDLIGYEMKNKKPFDDYNYAKIIINSNSLPSSEDTSEGFYRRWLIIDFPNSFKEGKSVIDTIPDQEFCNMALRVSLFIPQLLGNGSFSSQGSIEERTKKYIMASNPLPYFIEHCCKRTGEGWILHPDLFSAYCKFLGNYKRRLVTRREFNSVLDKEGLTPRRTTHYKEDMPISGYFIEGIELYSDWEERMTKIM
jgi:P4 family phage/plasmid primase-like protien